MRVKHLTLSNFRNHSSTDVALEPGVTIFLGENGHGKTNIVEAVHYLATTGSHRVAGFLPLINAAAEQAIVRAKLGNGDREVMLEVELNKNDKNRASVNKAKPGAVRSLLGYLNTVTFAPEDLDIIRRDPSNRRAFIDGLIAQLQPRFAAVFADYDRVLKQRNTLLKSAKTNRVQGSALATLDAWDEQLVALGTQIVVARGNLIDRLNPELITSYQQIAVTRNQPVIRLRSSLLATTAPVWGDEDDDSALEFLDQRDPAAIAELFRARLAALRDKELERGLTLAGPQRDDLVLLLNDLPAKGYASHGESWSFALALRLASLALHRADSKSGDPVLILDDVFAELDETRRNRLAELVVGNEQVLITSADAEVIPSVLKAKVFHVKQGVVTDA